MASPMQLMKLLRRGTTAAMGPTAPQELLGGLGLLKAAVRGKAKNLRLGQEGEVIYDQTDLDSPAAAMGSFVQTLPNAGDPDVLKHEMRHVKQSDRLGPLYLPAAVSETAFAPYGGGSLERDAIQHATPQSEILRPGSSMYEKPRKPAAHALLGALLGR